MGVIPLIGRIRRAVADRFARRHAFEPAISLRTDDGRLGVLRCTKCGYCVYPEDSMRGGPPCVPRAHEWVPVEVFQWEHVALANKLPRPLQCAACGAHASTRDEWERFGCPGSRREDP
jgi:hypothetical protein